MNLPINSLPSKSKKPSNLAAWIALAIVFVGSISLFTQHNSFPYTYHPDEDTKVRQIITGKRNFYHPLLMLSTADVAMKLGQIEKVSMNAAITGRWVSALFTAIAVCCFSILAWRWTGWIGGITTAILLLLNPLIFELAHYFKEDPALLMGLAVSFLAMDIFWKAPTRNSAIFLGIGCALAISGKYLGAIVFLFASIPLSLHIRRNGWSFARWFLLGFFVPLLLINLPLFLEWSTFQKGLSREMEGATEGHRGLNQSIPHAFYFGRMAELTPWGIWLGLAIAAIAALYQRRNWTLIGWLGVLFPIFFFILLSFSPKTAGRYLLPVQGFASLLAGVGIGWLIRKESKKISLVIGTCAAVTAVIGCIPLFGRYAADFAHDDRADLRIWFNDHTPPSTVIAEDGRVDLNADPNWKSRVVETSEYVADLGTVQDLRARGITHVAVARQTYNRYFNQKLKPNSSENEEYNRRSIFYRTLFKSGKPIWESATGDVIYLHPGIRVYQIAN